MKKILFAVITIGIFASFTQNPVRKIPATDVKTLNGQTFNTSKISNGGKPMVISFWATWCGPCIKELNAFSEVYTDWQKETGVKVIAFSIDDAKNSNKVKPFIDSKGWEFDHYIDLNSDFKRAMNVNMPPHTFVLNGNGEIVWEHVGYTEGSEAKVLEVIKKVAKGEKPE